MLGLGCSRLNQKCNMDGKSVMINRTSFGYIEHLKIYKCCELDTYCVD